MYHQIETQLTIDVANPSVEIARLCELLSSANITINATSISAKSHRGYFRFLSDNSEKATNLLRANGFTVRIDRVFSIQLNDRKGQLANITQALAQARINVDYVYASVDSSDATTSLIMKVSNIPLATRILNEIANASIKVPALELA